MEIRAPLHTLHTEQQRRRKERRQRGSSALDALGGSPESLESVEQTRLSRENVDDEIEVVEQDPFGSIVAFDVRRLGPVFRKRFHDAVGDGANLPGVRARADDEVIGKA